jgi:hypothetical protein
MGRDGARYCGELHQSGRRAEGERGGGVFVARYEAKGKTRIKNAVLRSTARLCYLACAVVVAIR